MKPENRSALALRSYLLNTAYTSGKLAPPLDRGTKGLIVGSLNHVLGGGDKQMGDDNRRLVLGWLFRAQTRSGISSKALSDGEWHALASWMKPFQDTDGDGRWKCEPGWEIEAINVLKEVQRLRAASIFHSPIGGLIAEAAALDGYKVITKLGNE